MKINRWTLGLAAVGLVSLAPAVLAQTASQQQTPLLTSLSATTISGYVDTSAVWNPGTGTANTAPYLGNKGLEQNGFNLDAVDIKLSKPLEEGKWSAGYVAELSYGSDATAIDAGAAPIRQAYVNLGIPVGNGLELKIGRWDSILGYESSDRMNNANFTYSYGKTFEPTENTGLLASYKFADWIGLQVGVADEISTIGLANSGYESKKGVTSLLTLVAPDSWGFLKGSALYGGINYGPGGGGDGNDLTEWYVGTTVNTPLTGLTFGASYDTVSDVAVSYPATPITFPGGVATPGTPAFTGDAGYFQSIAGYASYRFNDKQSGQEGFSSLNARVEYADGGALSVIDGLQNGVYVAPGTTGSLDKVFALTGTFEYDFWQNVISRLEVRWDHNSGGFSTPFGGETVGVPVKNNAVMFAANVIYKF